MNDEEGPAMEDGASSAGMALDGTCPAYYSGGTMVISSHPSIGVP